MSSKIEYSKKYRFCPCMYIKFSNMLVCYGIPATALYFLGAKVEETISVSAIVGSIVLFTIGVSRNISDNISTNQSRKSRAENKAHETEKLLATSRKTWESVQNVSCRINDELSEAERRFSANLFGPFWDQMENVAISLNEYSGFSRNLQGYCKTYGDFLACEKHTFPPFWEVVSSPPPIDYQLKQFERLLISGQSNFNFALIWEQRQTRKTIITGFSTLRDSIEGVGNRVVNDLKILGKVMNESAEKNERWKRAQEQIRIEERRDDNFDHRMEFNRLIKALK